MSMNSPFLLSIVLPTRERAEVLADTLENLLTINREDVEFIVCDNASQDETRHIVTSHNDSRLKYYRSPTRLSMAQNFEFGLTKATGLYVTTLGDDDFIIKENLELALNYAVSQQCDLIYWWRGCFYWGNVPDKRLAGFFLIPTGRNHYFVSGATLCDCALRGLFSYQYLPSIYNSICSRGFLEKYLSFFGGRYFPDYTIAVDAFSALVFSALSTSIYFLQSPVSVSGISHRSGGMSILFGGPENNLSVKEYDGYKSFADFMPEEVRSHVRILTPTGLSKISILIDYFSVSQKLLRTLGKPSIPVDLLTAIWLRDLVSANHIDVERDSCVFEWLRKHPKNDNCLPEDDMFFFKLFQIPTPQFYRGQISSTDVTVKHFNQHLESIGFNLLNS